MRLCTCIHARRAVAAPACLRAWATPVGSPVVNVWQYDATRAIEVTAKLQIGADAHALGHKLCPKIPAVETAEQLRQCVQPVGWRSVAALDTVVVGSTVVVRIPFAGNVVRLEARR